jgi:hypothetical protein
MSNYIIKQYSYNRIKELNTKIGKDWYSIKVSKNKKKKIDVFKQDKLIAQIGDSGSNDYPTYMLIKGKKYADERRRLYYLRHTNPDIKDGNITNSWFSKYIIW